MVRLPLYLKLSTIILGLVAFFYVLYIGREILVPLTFALIFSILLNPVTNFLVKLRFNRVVAIILAIFLMMILTGGILFFIASQVSMFSDAFPELKTKFNTILNQILVWITETFNIKKSQVMAWVHDQEKKGMSSVGGIIGETLSAMSGIAIIFLIIPVYMFLFLFYKPLLMEFIARLFSSDKHKVVHEVLQQTKSLIQNYLVGLMIEMSIVAALNSIALLIIGIRYAILLGVIGAILNLIPYIGGLIAISLPMIMGLLTDDPMSSLFVLAAYILVQFIDNNFLVPKIVASKVQINALVSIIVVLIGGAIWGFSGMFLSIPLTAIIKVVFDRVDTLKPFGYLIGDNMPDTGKSMFTFNFKGNK